jgi:hypothetical protein
VRNEPYPNSAGSRRDFWEVVTLHVVTIQRAYDRPSLFYSVHLIGCSSWYILGIIGFWAFGPETKGRTFEEMDNALDRPAAVARAVVQTAGN